MKIPSLETIQLFQSIPGAISVCEGFAIFNMVSDNPLPEGLRVDLGSHAGKSSMFAAAAMGPTGHLYMVDPVYDMTNLEAWNATVQVEPSRIPWSYCHTPEFKAAVNSRIKQVSGFNPTLVGDVSLSALPNLSELDKFAYVFIDSDDHQPELVDWEVKFLEDRMASGGLILFHDYNNQYRGPRESYDYLVSTGKYEKLEIPWGRIRDYVSEHKLELSNNSWHMPGHELPCFVGGLRKI